MMCDQTSRIHAYHDGELSAEQRVAVESHLADCPQCRALLEELREISRVLATAPMREMPQRAMSRMYGSWHKAIAVRAAQQRERSVRRLAEWLTAAAAAVLAVAVLHSRTHPSDVLGPSNARNGASADEPIPLVAMLPPAEEASSEMILAQFMANDLSAAERAAERH
ncbi:anti-sigma factor family protein [Fontivita pretiosa]|uniref:anti-sigma factor family protein n=1 Tax=Fontivita pretiosa TaxID=2989684 RepID=UPI003D16FAD0